MCVYFRIIYVCGHSSFTRQVDARCAVQDADQNIIGCSLWPDIQALSQYDPEALQEDFPCPATECRIAWTSRRAAAYVMQGTKRHVDVDMRVFKHACIEHLNWRISNQPHLDTTAEPLQVISGTELQPDVGNYNYHTQSDYPLGAHPSTIAVRLPVIPPNMKPPNADRVYLPIAAQFARPAFPLLGPFEVTEPQPAASIFYDPNTGAAPVVNISSAMAQHATYPDFMNDFSFAAASTAPVPAHAQARDAVHARDQPQNPSQQPVTNFQHQPMDAHRTHDSFFR